MAGDLSDALIDEHLRGSFGRPFRYLDETDSTNDRALSWLAEGAPEGALVVAEHQTSGRGRRGRKWEAPPGDALLFSVVLRPRGQAQVVELLTTAAGVACARALASFGFEVGLKWPNDVIVGDEKLVGILVESRVTGGSIAGAVAGIGMNVRWPQGVEGAAFPTPATSLARLAEGSGGEVPGRAALLGAVVAELERAYEGLATDSGREDVRREAAQRSTVLGREITVRFADGSSVSGRAEQLTSSGALALAQSDGATVILGVGEIERVRPT